ncbi:glycosyltransferase family 4 protein [Rhizobium sp. TRM95111]|uniref:glycosyltransferase family 4 protein n=1 Tax=Rhizobium alarense TaxID=2846851 RepID=UPI001F21696A|nr:glycosyltransferase family 4 protein [Rhizobium alarense]MCF3640498.1 glycosyltransferase family 4 protein [Rhizobium alarense]
MRIAFYAPMKSPRHPVPSGDRLMARLLVQALARKGHEVDLVSELRSHVGEPAGHAAVRQAAALEIARIEAAWRGRGPADLWFCYHPYYKAPDLIGPAVATRFAIPYVTAEASYAAKRDGGAWAAAQAEVVAALRQAAVNIAFTCRDVEGLRQAAPATPVERLPPFIDLAPYGEAIGAGAAGALVTVAMMRAGDKMRSYTLLAEALGHIADRPWSLSVVGDGPLQGEVRALFSRFAPERIRWHGECSPSEVSSILRRSVIHVWPGFGEAYGLAYLEAQASGLPVIAQHVAGVPEVVRDGETGLLTPPGDAVAYAAAIAGLLDDDRRRRELAENARRIVRAEHSVEGAADRLEAIVERHVDRGKRV